MEVLELSLFAFPKPQDARRRQEGRVTRHVRPVQKVSGVESELRVVGS